MDTAKHLLLRLLESVYTTDGKEMNDLFIILAAWVCEPCGVEGRSVDAICWNCAGPVVVTARPVVQRTRFNDETPS